MKYNIGLLLLPAVAVIIFTRTLASPLGRTHTNLQPGISIAYSVWLFSANSRGFVRVKGSSVDSHGVKTDASAKLQLESARVNGSVGVRIRSVTENSYICVNAAGDLAVEVHGNTLDRCVFKEELFSGYRTFQSLHNLTWHLGFKRNGKVKQPHNTTFSQKAARFTRYFSLSDIP